MTAPEPARPAFFSLPWPKLDLGHVVIFDMVAESGSVALQCGNVSIHLHTEEQARALIAAAGKAAAMFAAASVPQPVITGVPADVLTAVVETNARLLAEADACGRCGTTDHDMDPVTDSRVPGGVKNECRDLHDCTERAAVKA